jgi:hypothetical protein
MSHLMKKKMFAFCIFLLITALHFESKAQSLSESENDTINKYQQPPEASQHYLTLDAGYSLNSLVRFRGINSIIAFGYGYRFSNVYGIEVAMYYADAMKETYGGLFGNILTSLAGSVSATTKPFTDVPFRMGVGGAMRWYSSLEGNAGAVYFNLPPIYYIEAVQLGINAQLEYAFPLTNSIDIGIRGQGQVFFEPFFLRSNADAASVVPTPILQLVPQLNPKATSYVVNLGAFLRINF